jgi:hypothetical protein
MYAWQACIIGYLFVTVSAGTVWGWTIRTLSLKPMAILMMSLDMQSPREETGGALSQAPDSFDLAAEIQALDS